MHGELHRAPYILPCIPLCPVHPTLGSGVQEGLLSSGSLGIPGLTDKLEGYSVMHHRCTAGIHDWDAFFTDQ